MPTVKVFIYGNIPAELDLGVDGEPFGLSVETTQGVKWADMSDIELAEFAAKFQPQITEALDESRRNIEAWKGRTAHGSV